MDQPDKERGFRPDAPPPTTKSYLVALLAVVLGLLIIITTTISLLLNNHRRIPIYIQNGNGTARAPVQLAIAENFPDPSLLFHNNTWYAYATNDAAGIFNPTEASFSYRPGIFNIQLATSTDFIDWEIQNFDVFPNIGDWAIQGRSNIPEFDILIPRANAWAPNVIRRPSDGKYVLYYAAASNGPTINPYGQPAHCVRAAVADSPTGPFRALDKPLACPYKRGGAIDPYGFVDKDHSMYVVYKIDGNSIGHGGLCGNTVPPMVPTPIMLQKMMPDGVTPDGSPIQILDRTLVDGPLVEAPALIRSKRGSYYLFYSSGCTVSPTYDIRYAVADNISGPYTRMVEPLLSTGDWNLEAPGSVGLLDNVGGRWDMVFHARVDGLTGGVRAMFTTSLALNGDQIQLASNM